MVLTKLNLWLHNWAVHSWDKQRVGGTTWRYTVNVLVNDQPDREELRKIAKHLMTTYRKISIEIIVHLQFYDYPEYIGRETPPLGHYADVNKRTADNLKDKDWSLQPRQEDVDLWLRWREILDTLTDDESAAYKVLAEEQGTDCDAVQASVRRALFWPHV